MFQFENPEYLWLLLGIPIYVFLDWLLTDRWRSKVAEPELLSKITIGSKSVKKVIAKVLLIIGLFFILLSLANPQWGTKREKVQSKGSDIILALDISQSMLCEDIAPNRLERAKRFTEKLLDRLKGERVGVILFAGSAYLQMPMTTDYAAAELFIKSANPRLAASQGTAIGDAIALSKRVFGNEGDYHKALIVITDGETHDVGAMEEAQSASDMDMILFFVGVGTQEGGYVPFEVNGRLDYMRDQSGDFVKSKLDEDVMRSLSEAGNGEYFNIVGGERILEELDKRIDQLEKKELEQRSFEEFESYFQYFLALGLLLILIGYLIFSSQKALKI